MINRVVSSGTISITALACLLLIGCVPVPFKPSATASHTTVAMGETATRVTAANSRSEAQSVAKTIREGEPRIVLVDASALSVGVTSVTLAQVLETAGGWHEALGADYVLSVGQPTVRQMHDTGAAAPFLFVPSVIGYEKMQSRDTLSATLVNLRDPQTLTVLCASSTYSEVAAGLFYGVMTIAMPEGPLREALAHEVTRTIAEAQPQGPIRLLVLNQVPKDPKSQDPKSAAASLSAGCVVGPAPAAAMTAAAH